MKRIRLAGVALVPLLAVGCSETTGITIDNLAGTWSATQLQFTNTANPSQTVDLIAAGGAFAITIAANGDYTATMTEPGDAPEQMTGTVAVAGDVLTISESGQGSPTPYVAARSGNTLTLTNTDEEFDFDQDGIEEDASLRVVMQKM